MALSPPFSPTDMWVYIGDGTLKISKYIFEDGEFISVCRGECSELRKTINGLAVHLRLLFLLLCIIRGGWVIHS